MHQETPVPVPLCSPALLSLSLLHFPCFLSASPFPLSLFFLTPPSPVAPAWQGAVATSVSKVQLCHLGLCPCVGQVSQSGELSFGFLILAPLLVLGALGQVLASSPAGWDCC